MSIYSILVTVLAALLFAFSAAQLGLSAYMVHYGLSRRNETFTWTTTINTTYQIYWLPYHNQIRSYILQLVTGVLGVILGAAVFGVLASNKPLTIVGTGKRAPRTITWPLTTVVLSFLVFALALSSLVVSFYDNTHYGAHTIVSAGLCLASHRTSFSNGCSVGQAFQWFTMEAWTCRVGPLYRSATRVPTDDAMTVLPRTCRIAYISRWWTIAPMLIPILIIVIALFEMRRKNIIRFNERQEQSAGLYPKEQSFSSAATANETPFSPTGTLPQYSAAPELGSDAGNKHETAGKQVMEAPEKLPYEEMSAGHKHEVYSELSANKSKVEVDKDAPAS